MIKLEHFGAITPSTWLPTPELKLYLSSMGIQVSKDHIRKVFKDQPEQLKPFMFQFGTRFKIHKDAMVCYLLGIDSHPGIEFKPTPQAA